MALQTVKSGMPVIISSCSHKTFYAEYTYNGCKPDVKKAIIKWAVDGAGIRATARELGVSTDTVIKELKKRSNDRIGEQRVSFIP
jgi:transposase-like protein